MAVTFQKVKSAQVAERSRFLESLDRAQAAVEPVVMDAVDQFDLFLTRVEGIVDGGGDGGGDVEGRTLRDAPASAAATPSAPSTNRGATGNKKKAAKPAMARLTADSASKRNLKKRGLSKDAI